MGVSRSVEFEEIAADHDAVTTASQMPMVPKSTDAGPAAAELARAYHRRRQHQVTLRQKR
jgi:hypothetical protein